MSTKKKPASNIANRRAKFDYELGDELMAGIILSGPEVRAARDGHVQLKGSYVTIKGNALLLINSSFSLKGDGKSRAVDSSPRQLLVHKTEFQKLVAAKNQGSTIVPVKLLTHGRFIKLIIATGKGKKTYDKRETIKRRQQDREASRAIKNH